MRSRKSGYLAEKEGSLWWGPLVQGTLVRRYQRFLAEVRLRNGRPVTAHCPNTGSMLSCSQPGRPVWLSRHDDPGRKLKYTWEIIHMPESLVGVNTQVPNRLVGAAARAGLVRELDGYDRFRAEVPVEPGSRLDLVLSGPGRRDCYIEVKNCTLVQGGAAGFPDAVTHRGRKHLEVLARLAQDGGRAVIFFLVQRLDAHVFRPADHIDPEYGRVLRAVVRAGVEALAYDVFLDIERIGLNGPVPIEL
ncbi:MAG: DNA/RNA nuclease SfsA [Thermodesulfobacteriota bacterium]